MPGPGPTSDAVLGCDGAGLAFRSPGRSAETAAPRAGCDVSPGGRKRGVSSWPARVAVTTQLDRIRSRYQEGSLTALLVVQVIVIFGLVPASASGLPIAPELAALLLLLFTSLTVVMARRRWTSVLGGVTVALAGLSAGLENWSHGWETRVAGELAGLVTCLMLAVVVLHAIFGPGRFTGHRIRGAMVFYLNLGLVFAFMHRIVAQLVPGAYDHVPPPHQAAAFRAALDYFSLVTLTSVGFGDIVPVAPVARSLSALEAVVGQVLPTILIARVVTLAMRDDRHQDPPATF